MTLTSTEQPEALPNDQFFQLWQAYCDKKSECEDLRERIAELEAAQAQRVPLSNQDAETIVRDCDYDPLLIIRATEVAHGITQEKQG